LNLKEKVLCNGEKRKKYGKILKVDILRGVFIGYKDILPNIDFARSERPVSFLLKSVDFNNTAFAESQGKTSTNFEIFLEELILFVENYLLPCHMCKKW
jgi:hypothetical protein